LKGEAGQLGLVIDVRLDDTGVDRKDFDVGILFKKAMRI
jgi:hypothetical protein